MAQPSSANSSHVRYESGRGAGGVAGPVVPRTGTGMVWHAMPSALHGMNMGMYGMVLYTVRARDVSDFWELLPQIIVVMRPLLYKVAASADTSDVTLNRKPRLVSI